MKFTKRIPYFIIGLLVLLGTALVIVPSGMRFSGYLMIAMALLWAAGLVLGRLSRRGGGWRVLWRVYLAGLGLGVTVFLTIEGLVIFHGERDVSAVPVDAVIVLGAGVNGETPSGPLWTRIQKTAEYLKDHPGVPVVLSGGQGPGEDISEAEAMRRALWTNSEEANALYLLEDRSTNTAENFRYAKALLEEYGIDTETALVAVVTNDFHCFRAHLIARHEGLRVIDVPAELPWWWLTANYYLREAVGVVKTVLLDLR